MLSRRNILKATALSPLALIPSAEVKAVESAEQYWANYIEQKFVENIRAKNPVLQTFYGANIFYDTDTHFYKDVSQFYGWVEVQIRQREEGDIRDMLTHFNNDMLKHYGFEEEDLEKVVKLLLENHRCSSDYGCVVTLPILLTEQQINGVLTILRKRAGKKPHRPIKLCTKKEYIDSIARRKAQHA